MKMEEIKVKEKDIVIPGDVLAEGMGFLPSRHIYRAENRLIASKLGVVEIDGKVIKLTPLSGIYLPKAGDVIIARVGDILISGWKFDTYSPYPAVLNLKEATSAYISKGADLTRYFCIGDHVATQIINVTSQNLVDVTMKGPGLKKLKDGRLVTINAFKVPRVIGKKGSMVSMIKEATNCRITVGQNGVIWVEGEPKQELIAVEAIKQIEKGAHTSGLTDRIKLFLEQHANIKPEEKKAQIPKLR